MSGLGVEWCAVLEGFEELVLVVVVVVAAAAAAAAAVAVAGVPDWVA